MVEVLKEDITGLNVEAIVNAANEYLSHGGGVAKAISKAAGGELQRESNDIIREQGPLKIGGAVYTNSGNLQGKGIKYVIHAVGPRGTKPELLKEAIRNVFKLSIYLNVKSIALPAISCGVFGFDKEEGSRIIFGIAKEYEGEFERVVLTSLDKYIFDYWTKYNGK